MAVQNPELLCRKEEYFLREALIPAGQFRRSGRQFRRGQHKLNSMYAQNRLGLEEFRYNLQKKVNSFRARIF